MRVLAVDHGEDVRAELFGDWIGEDGHELVEWHIAGGGPVPAADAVLVLGGSMNVGDEDRHPWLDREYGLLRGWVESGTPLFAICLGSQALAHALGGPVGPAGRSLGGFVDTELTAAGIADPVLGVLPAHFEALNANGYAFEVPPGAVDLARGPCAQAFRAGERAWGVQFHPEARRDQFLGWLRERPRVSLADVEAELDAKLPVWQEHGRRLCHAFLAAAGS